MPMVANRKFKYVIKSRWVNVHSPNHKNVPTIYRSYIVEEPVTLISGHLKPILVFSKMYSN